MHSEVSRAQDLLGRVDKWHLKNSQINIDTGDTLQIPVCLANSAALSQPEQAALIPVPVPQEELLALWDQNLLCLKLLSLKGFGELVIPYRPKTIEITLQERLKDTRKRILLSLPKMLAPVRLVVAAPPLREASAGGWQRARWQAYINGNENPTHFVDGTMEAVGRIFFSFHLFSLCLTRSGFHRAKEKKDFACCHLGITFLPVNTLLSKPVFRGDCTAVFMHLWYIICPAPEEH